MNEYVKDSKKAKQLADKTQLIINALRGAFSGYMYEMLRALLSAAHDMMNNASLGYVIKSYAYEKIETARTYLEMIDDE